ncbi:hypothetical protein CENSYa_0854 [Cenarchaeum symbiosum A]|uniref:Uncharacterized protein n=1 Tax=Cenarchaeum symbiosum (strain A) TaxID=414004 RepID=A0RVX0_CENSY|nr:hypothetical protein CENSYa_0854 [Cenarchaeum symbiosum A]
MKHKLAGFIKYLENRGMLDFGVIDHTMKTCSDADFDNRMRLQRYVGLAEEFGLGRKYKINRKGKSWRKLIKEYHGADFNRSDGQRILIGDYHEIAKNRRELYDPVEAHLPESFREEEFLALVEGKDDDWLYVATEALKLAIDERWNENLIDSVECLASKTVKGDCIPYTKEYIAGVVGDLEAAGLVKVTVPQA